jgi:hypothetical protein
LARHVAKIGEMRTMLANLKATALGGVNTEIKLNRGCLHPVARVRSGDTIVALRRRIKTAITEIKASSPSAKSAQHNRAWRANRC